MAGASSSFTEMDEDDFRNSREKPETRALAIAHEKSLMQIAVGVLVVDHNQEET